MFITVPPLPGTEADTIIYNRECYFYLRKFMFESNEGKEFDRFCITGNPGIGKTYFGILLLVELLSKGQSVLIDNKDYTAFISPDGKLRKVDRDQYFYFARLDNAWCIIDGKEPQVGHDFRGAKKLIMVSSPKKDIVGKFTKAKRTRTFYMPTWEKREFLECERLYEEGVTKSLVEKKFELCGGNARWVFDSKMPLDDIESILKAESANIDLGGVLKSLGESFSGDGFSHKLIHIKSHLNIDEDVIDADEDVTDDDDKMIYQYDSHDLTNSKIIGSGGSYAVNWKTHADEGVGEIDVEGLQSQLKGYLSEKFYKERVARVELIKDIRGLYGKAICTFASEYVKEECLMKFRKDHM